VLDHIYLPERGALVGYSAAGKEVLILDDLGREVDRGYEGEIAVSNFAAAHTGSHIAGQEANYSNIRRG
jgi:hypothetical protein